MNTQKKLSVKQWWVSMTAGIVYVLIGGIVFIYPTESYIGLTNLFIIGFGVIGLLGIYYALSNRKDLQHWGWVLMTALIDCAIVFLLLVKPNIKLFILPLYVGFVLLFRSIIGVGFSSYLSHFGVRNWGWVLVLSLLGMATSFLLIWSPSFAAWALVTYTGIALLAVGFAQIGVAYELQRHEDKLEH